MRKAMVPMLLLSIVVLAAAAPVEAQGGTAIARLRAFEEVPALSTPGGGRVHRGVYYGGGAGHRRAAA